MSEIEDPVATVVRLLSKNMWVVKEDGSLASILVSREWYDRELFKNYDGQITVGLTESREARLEISGRLRRRLGGLRVNVWATDKPSSSDSGKLIRQKMVEEVNRIIRQNRNKPNETLYYFRGIGQATGTHKAYHAGSAEELIPQHANWNELTNVEYEKIWYSDDNRYSKSHNVNGEYALMLFRFKIDSREKIVKKIVLAFEGYGTAPEANGCVLKVWHHVAGAWQIAGGGSGGGDESIVVTLTVNLSNYIDEDGYVWLLARTVNPSNGVTPAVLYCDYVSCTVTVNGITYLDIISYRNVDRVNVKPFVFCSEFSLVSWLFESVSEAT